MHKKVAFIGSVGSGKTTIINSLSSIETVNTDVESTVDIGKEFTTVGIDYGHISLGEDMSVGLYGVPGQRRFSFVWDYVKEGLWGVVILIKFNDQSSLEELANLIEHFELGRQSACVIGMTHSEDEDTAEFTQAISSVTQARGMQAPIFQIDARSRSSALLIMNTLIALKEMEAYE